MEAAETSLGRPDVEGENEAAVPGGGGGPASARSSPGPDTDKIYKLLSEIQVKKVLRLEHGSVTSRL